MKIYLDILFLTNLILTIGFLSGCGRLCHIKLPPKRLMLGGVIGGSGSMILLIDTDGFWVALLITLLKLGVLAGMTALVFRPRSRKEMLKYALIYLCQEVLFGGACMVIWEATGCRVIVYKNYTPYLDIPLWLMCACIIGCYLVMIAFDSLAMRREIAAASYRVRYILGDCEITMPAVCDTGNMLEDVFSGAPVVVFSCRELYRRFDLDSSDALYIRGFHLIPYSTVEGRRLMPVTSKGRVLILDGEGLVKEVNCSAGILDSDEPPRAIFNPHLLI